MYKEDQAKFLGILIAGLNKSENSLWIRGGLHGFPWLAGREGGLGRVKLQILGYVKILLGILLFVLVIFTEIL